MGGLSSSVAKTEQIRRKSRSEAARRAWKPKMLESGQLKRKSPAEDSPCVMPGLLRQHIRIRKPASGMVEVALLLRKHGKSGTRPEGPRFCQRRESGQERVHALFHLSPLCQRYEGEGPPRR